MPVFTRPQAATPTIRTNTGLGLLATLAIAIATVALLRPQADARPSSGRTPPRWPPSTWWP